MGITYIQENSSSPTFRSLEETNENNDNANIEELNNNNPNIKIQISPETLRELQN